MNIDLTLRRSSDAPLSWAQQDANLLALRDAILGTGVKIESREVRAGILSDDGSGNYVPNMGGLFLGASADNTKGVQIRQEGFLADYESGSWAAYPLEANRWCGLSICPSGNPEDLPTENVTSLALQMRNGASEERLVVATKWFGSSGEYRIAPFKSGSGSLWPLIIANGDSRLMFFNTDKSISINNMLFSGASGGNTLLKVESVAHTSRLELFSRTNGDRGLANYQAGVFESEIRGSAFGWQIVGNLPSMYWREVDVPADNRLWSFDAEGGRFRGFAWNDTVSASSQWLDITRSGASVMALSFHNSIGTITALPSYANDTAAASGGVRLYGFYWSTSVNAIVQRRV